MLRKAYYSIRIPDFQDKIRKDLTQKEKQSDGDCFSSVWIFP